MSEFGRTPSAALTAASIAMAESGGNQYATGSVGERGYWQINPVNGALSTTTPAQRTGGSFINIVAGRHQLAPMDGLGERCPDLWKSYSGVR